MAEIKYPVDCPLMGKLIDEGTCFDIHMVVCGEAPKWTAPEKIYKFENYKEICNHCKFHRDD